MSDVWVANASPVIVLAKCGYLELLTNLSREVVLPQVVIDEIVAGPPTDPARQLIEGGWGTRAIVQLVAPELLECLGPGETSVLALAQGAFKQLRFWMTRPLAPVPRSLEYR